MRGGSHVLMMTVYWKTPSWHKLPGNHANKKSPKDSACLYGICSLLVILLYFALYLLIIVTICLFLGVMQEKCFLFLPRHLGHLPSIACHFCRSWQKVLPMMFHLQYLPVRQVGSLFIFSNFADKFA